MVGKLADYTASKLESMKFDLAAVARISPSAISFNVVSTGADVVLSATMPAAAAAEVVAMHADNSFTSLGSQQVQTTAAGRSHATALRFGPSWSSQLLSADATCDCSVQVLAASLAQTTGPSALTSQGKLWIALDIDAEALQAGALVAIQVALAGALGHMAIELMLAAEMPLSCRYPQLARRGCGP